MFTVYHNLLINKKSSLCTFFFTKNNEKKGRFHLEKYKLRELANKAASNYHVLCYLERKMAQNFPTKIQ